MAQFWTFCADDPNEMFYFYIVIVKNSACFIIMCVVC